MIIMGRSEKLISLVESRPPLYNSKLKEHRDKKIIEKMWLEVAHEMQCDVGECRSKWTTLRNSYSRCLREEANWTVSNGIRTKKTWYLANTMTFLKEHMKAHRSSRISTDTNVSIVMEEDTSFSIKVEMPESSVQDNCSSKTLNKPIEKRLIAEDKLGESMAEDDRPRSKRRSFEDANMQFFSSLLPDMNNLSEKRQRILKRETLLRLHELIEEQEIEVTS